MNEQKPWFEWMEEVLKTMTEKDIDCIALVARLKDKETMTAQYHASNDDLVLMAGHLLGDVVIDIATDIIKGCFEEEGETE